MALSALALCGMLTLPALTMAETASQDTAGQNKSAKVRKITGCLAKTDSGNEYTLTTENGATWELRSNAVNFASHVGHTMTVTGTVDNATAHGIKEKAKEKTTDNATEHGHMTVTNLKMVSEDCRK